MMSDEPTGVIVSPPDNGFAVRVDRHQVVNARGELDAATDLQFAAALSPLVAEGGVICVDLSAVRFCGAAGINVLFGAVQALGTRGRVVIYDPPPQVSRVIVVSGLGGVVEVVHSRVEPAPADRRAPSSNIADADATPPSGHIESPDVDPRPVSAA
jgi:anti-anti-sigma factor